jgi:hypothetical protein
VSDKPIDPAQENVEQGQRETQSYEGQAGYGVEYEDGQYENPEALQSPSGVRGANYETNNTGGYGAGPAIDDGRTTDPTPTTPPDPEAQQGQGGQ